jgi:hypothetical protein
MRKVREVLRLRHALSLSYREIGEALGVSKTAAGEIVRRAEVIGLSWPLPQLFDDGELERRLFTAAGEAQTERPARMLSSYGADTSIAGTMPARAGPAGIVAASVGVAVTDGAVPWDGGAGTMAIAAFTANVASIAIFGAAGAQDRQLAVRQ